MLAHPGLQRPEPLPLQNGSLLSLVRSSPIADLVFTAMIAGTTTELALATMTLAPLPPVEATADVTGKAGRPIERTAAAAAKPRCFLILNGPHLLVLGVRWS